MVFNKYVFIIKEDKMRIGFNPYGYSSRLADNNSESKQKIQRQNNNYDLAFGKKPMTLSEFAKISAILFGAAAALTTIINFILQR